MFNHVRPHEALGLKAPGEIYGTHETLQPALVEERQHCRCIVGEHGRLLQPQRARRNYSAPRSLPAAREQLDELVEWCGASSG
jgi:hypothetical protein